MHRLSDRELEEEVMISIGSCHDILFEKLNIYRVATKFVPHLIIEQRKENRSSFNNDNGTFIQANIHSVCLHEYTFARNSLKKPTITKHSYSQTSSVYLLPFGHHLIEIPTSNASFLIVRGRFECARCLTTKTPWTQTKLDEMSTI